tara:strand:+ start:1820 stop:3583 length:1764 start_codon:yes stop_codon:yes gene_type:complete
MGYQGSNFEPGMVPESGTIAGPGSYVALNDGDEFILTSAGGGDTDPGGSNTQVQFNDSDEFGGDSGFTYNKTSNTVMITGSLRLTGSEAPILVIEKAPGDTTKEIVFVEEGVEQGGIYFNNSDHLFVRNENNAKDIILRIENSSNAGRNLVRLDGESEAVIVGFANAKTAATNNCILDVDGNTIITGSLQTTDFVSASTEVFGGDLRTSGNASITGSMTSNNIVVNGGGVTNGATVSVTANDTLTTGQALYIDHDDAATTAVGPASIRVDFDKDGVMGNSQAATYKGIAVDMADAATNHAGSTVNMLGVDIGLSSDNPQGTLTNIAANLSSSGADNNFGLRIITDDAEGSADIKMDSSLDGNDYATIAVQEHGALSITTVDGGAAAANIEIEADGNIEMETVAGGQFDLESNNANGPGTGWNTSGMVSSKVANINGEIVTTILVDIQGTRGYDGTNADGRVIGRDGQSNAYLTRVQQAINGYVYRIEFSCIEEPNASSNPQKNIVLSADDTARAQGVDGSSYDHLVDLNNNWARGTSKSSADGATFGNGLDDDYLYLTNGSSAGDDNDYTAGKFVIKLYGANFTGQG